MKTIVNSNFEDFGEFVWVEMSPYFLRRLVATNKSGINKMML
jgi:hypothetical protein